MSTNTTEQVSTEATKPELLTISATREDRSYIFSFPEGVQYAEIADVLLQMRDHVCFVGRIELQKQMVDQKLAQEKKETTQPH